MGRFGGGRIFVLIDRDAYWQCGYVIAKGTIDEIRRHGIEAFRESVAASCRSRGIGSVSFAAGMT